VSERRVAIILGGSARVWDDVLAASAFYQRHGMEPVWLAANDMIEHFPAQVIAVTLHPAKLRTWLAARRQRGYQMPAHVYAHDGADSRQRPNVSITHRLKDWGGSVGMFGYVVARHLGFDRVLLCGVPMTSDNHFVRNARWTAVDHFTRPWEAHRDEMLPYVRSLSGGWTEQLFGAPDEQWLESRTP
jgi:hypothetical protein